MFRCSSSSLHCEPHSGIITTITTIVDAADCGHFLPLTSFFVSDGFLADRRRCCLCKSPRTHLHPIFLSRNTRNHLYLPKFDPSSSSAHFIRPPPALAARVRLIIFFTFVFFVWSIVSLRSSLSFLFFLRSALFPFIFRMFYDFVHLICCVSTHRHKHHLPNSFGANTHAAVPNTCFSHRSIRLHFDIFTVFYLIGLI